MVIFLLHLVQGSLVYGRHGQEVYRAELDVDICKEVVTCNHVSKLFFTSSILLEFYSCIVRYALSVEVLILHFIPLLGRTIFLNKFGRFLLFDWFFMFGIKCILFQHMLLLPFPFLTLQTILSPLGFFTKKSL